MSKDELSLLLYLETRTVDYGGRVDLRMMNIQDNLIVEKWTQSNYIEFGRIVAKDHNRQGTMWVKLSETAMADAHKERIARANRMWARRLFKTTNEKQNS